MLQILAWQSIIFSQWTRMKSSRQPTPPTPLPTFDSSVSSYHSPSSCNCSSRRWRWVGRWFCKESATFTLVSHRILSQFRTIEHRWNFSILWHKKQQLRMWREWGVWMVGKVYSTRNRWAKAQGSAASTSSISTSLTNSSLSPQSHLNAATRSASLFARRSSDLNMDKFKF